MKAPVHILATVRRPELLPAALLVFQTLRTGFPSAPVTVWSNALPVSAAQTVQAAAYTHGCNFRDLPATSHDAWIEALILDVEEPFWICDTDLVFWKTVEDWFKTGLTGLSGLKPGKINPVNHVNPVSIAGRFEPAYRDDYTGCAHVERLHTCLMFIDPAAVRAAMRAYVGQFPLPWRTTAQNVLFRQTFIPMRNAEFGMRHSFYDSMAGFYQACGGTAFTPEQDACFDHLHAATYVDELRHHEPTLAADLQTGHNLIYHNPALAHGIKAAQDKFYQERKL